jgi:hypothetical protein
MGIDRLSANGERERFTPDVSVDYGRYVSDANPAVTTGDRRHLDIAVTSRHLFFCQLPSCQSISFAEV